MVRRIIAGGPTLVGGGGSGGGVGIKGRRIGTPGGFVQAMGGSGRGRGMRGLEGRRHAMMMHGGRGRSRIGGSERFLVVREVHFVIVVIKRRTWCCQQQREREGSCHDRVNC